MHPQCSEGCGSESSLDGTFAVTKHDNRQHWPAENTLTLPSHSWSLQAALKEAQDHIATLKQMIAQESGTPWRSPLVRHMRYTGAYDPQDMYEMYEAQNQIARWEQIAAHERLIPRRSPRVRYMRYKAYKSQETYEQPEPGGSVGRVAGERP